MAQPHSTLRRMVLLSAEASSAAEELAEVTGSSPREFIEAMLLDLRERMVAEAEAEESPPAGVIPISRGQRRGRRYPRPPRSGG